MGQTIEINNTKTVDRVLIVDTDRSIAGQDGETFKGVEAARRGTTFPARLAVRIFESDGSVDHVFVMSNTVSVRRLADWDADSVESTTRIITEFFRFYD